MSWIAHVNLTFERLALQNTDASLEGNYIHLKFYPGCDKLEQKRPRHRTLSETTRPKQIQCGLALSIGLWWHLKSPSCQAPCGDELSIDRDEQSTANTV
jgi:hypothetical protein